MSGQLIILTCNVQPAKGVDVIRNNESVRLKDYVESINKWIKLVRSEEGKILVLENSGNLDKLKASLKTVRYEHLYFFETPKDCTSTNQGISAGEFAMLHDALPYVLSIQDIEYCWKVTGRLFVENFFQISGGNTNQVTVNRFYKPFHLVDSRFIGFPKEVFQDLVSKKPEFRKKDDRQQITFKPGTFSSLEEYLTIYLTEKECLGLQVAAMKKIPIFSGTSASTDKKLNSASLFLKLKFANLIRPITLKLLGGSSP